MRKYKKSPFISAKIGPRSHYDIDSRAALLVSKKDGSIELALPGRELIELPFRIQNLRGVGARGRELAEGFKATAEGGSLLLEFHLDPGNFYCSFTISGPQVKALLNSVEKR